jgi:hypothetical protein
VNGTLWERSRSFHFYVDVRAQNNEVLLPAIRETLDRNVACVMLFGARSAGKSTRIDAAVNELREEGVFVALRVSLQRVNVTTEELFWSTLCRELRGANPATKTPEFSSAAEFISCFAVAFDKPVVLFLDEFDLLYSSAPARVQDSVLRTIRGIREFPAETRLRAVVAIGAFGILDLVGKTGSPFNVRDTMQVPSFTEEQVRLLFGEYKEARGVELDDRIVVDIFQQTRGHAGSVTFMGRFIDEVLLRTERPKIGYDAWARAGLRLRRALADSANLKKLVDVLRLPEDAVTEEERSRSGLVLSARKLLVTMLHSSEPVLVDGTEERGARFLAAEGALVAVETEEGRKFVVHSAAVRAILCARVLPLERRAIPAEPVPVADGKLVVARMLRAALRCFDRRVCIDERLFKKSVARGVIGSFAAQEDVFQTEFLAVLKAWLPAYLQIVSQPPLVAVADRVDSVRGRPAHSDMLIPGIGNQHAVLFELAAQVSEASVKEHIVRARSDAVSLGAQEAWMIHFTTGSFVEWPGPLLEAGQVPVHVMHVKYDTDWSKLSVRIDGNVPEEINVE